MKDALLFLIVTLGIIFVVRLLHFLLGRFGFYDWLNTWLWNRSKKEGDVFYRMSAWMERRYRSRKEPAAAPASAPASAGTRAAKPQSGTHVLVWVCLTFLALSLLGNVVIVSFFRGVFSQQKEESYSLHRRIGTLEQRVPEDVLTTSMLVDVKTADLTIRLDRDFIEINRRLEAIEEEPALDLTSSEVDFLHGNDWKLGRMIVLASLTDTDQDGVMDAYDEWPTIPRDRDVPDSDINGGRDYVYWSDGKPAADTDDDDINDVVDRCPTEAGSNYNLYTVGGIPQAEQLIDQIEIQFYGCPDSDKDWIPDAVDVCPTKKADNYEEDDQNLDGCPDEEQNFSQGVVDYRYVTEKPAYGDASGKLVGRFTAERTVGDVVIEFLIACEAMGADGAQLAGDADRNLVKKWGVCRPVGGV